MNKRTFKKDLRSDLEGINLSWLAKSIILPDGTQGVNRHTFFDWMTGRWKMPDWAVAEIKRLTNRNIDNIPAVEESTVKES